MEIKSEGKKASYSCGCLGSPSFLYDYSCKYSDIHPEKIFLSDLGRLPRLEKVLVDKGYQGMNGNYRNCNVEVSSKKPIQVGFVPVHKRWVVERTFAWLSRQRRLAKKYEFKIDHQKPMVYMATSRIMLRKLG